MTTTTIQIPGIRNIEFLNNSILFIHLDNDRTLLIPLDKFPSIKNLTPEQKKEYEILDEHNLSFLALDDIYSINDLIGIE